MPDSIGSLTALKYLNMNQNKISGAIPPSFGLLSSLEFADFGSNELSSSLPPSLGNLSSLKQLLLSSNYLTGGLPSEIGNLHSLEEFSASFNKLSGDIPASLGDLRSLAFLALAYNNLENAIPPSLVSLCRNPACSCVFTGNIRLCGDRSRVISETCETFPSCGPLGTCHSSFDPGSYLCARCLPGFYDDGGGACKDCGAASSPAGGTFTLAALAVILAAAGAIWALVKFKYIKPRKLNLGLRNQVRVKQVGSVLQMVPLLTTLTVYPPWFKSVVNVFGRVSLPVAVAPSCFDGVKKWERWEMASVAFVLLYVLVGILVGLRHVLVPLAVKVKPQVYLNLQIVAGIIVTQSPLVLLRMSIDAQEIVSNVVEKVDTYRVSSVTSILVFFGPELLSFVVALAIMIFTFSLIQSGSFYLKSERDAFQCRVLAAKAAGESSEPRGGGGEIEDSPPLDDESLELQLNVHLPFWSSFGGLPYTPSCADFESRLFLRKCASFILPHIVFFSTYFVAAFDSLNNNRYTPVYHFSPFAPFDSLNVPLVASSINAILFVLVQCLFLKSVLRRPYISTRRSAEYGDPLNDAEILATRALCWTATMFALKEGLFASDWGRVNFYWFGSVICTLLLFGLFAAQWTLFSDLIRDVRKHLSSTFLTNWAVFRLSREVRLNSSDTEGASLSIEAMLRCDSALAMFRLQSLFDLAALDPEERRRWEPPPNPPPRPRLALRIARRVGGLALLTLMAGAGVVALLAVMYASCTVSAMRWVWLAGAVSCTLGMEAMLLWHRGTARGGGLTSFVGGWGGWKRLGGGAGGVNNNADEFSFRNPILADRTSAAATKNGQHSQSFGQTDDVL